MKKAIVALLIICLITVIGVGGYYLYSLIGTLNGKNTEQQREIDALKNDVTIIKDKVLTLESSNKDKDEDEDKDKEKDEENDDEEDTDENLVKDLVLDEIKLTYGKSEEKLLDYRVDKVELLTDQQKKNLISTVGTYKETDILANVTYSLKPENVDAPVWTVGNGEVKGDWVVNKSACVCVREEKLRGGLSTGW